MAKNDEMKFEIIDLKKGGYYLFEKSNNGLIGLGDIGLRKENKKNRSHCYQSENKFNYHGIRKALCKKTIYFGGGEYFTPKRILVIQMV